jgi:hypothetical protein
MLPMTNSCQPPDSWPTVTPETMQFAKERCLDGLNPGGPNPVGPRLARYYDRNGNYVGRSFVALTPNDPHDVTALDLHATSLLSVDLGPQATRQLLEPGPVRDGVLNALHRIPVVALEDASDDDLRAVADLYRAVKSAISSMSAKDPNPWVTASKLCARKRPALFPVRDRNVCGLLGLQRHADFRKDLTVYRYLVLDPEVGTALRTLPELALAAAGRHLAVDTHPLRLLDAALWTYTVN